MRIGVLTEFPSPAVQSGPAIHTRFLSHGLTARGHEVVLMGPNTGHEAPFNGEETHLYTGVPWPTHPKVRVSLPGPNVKHLWQAPQLDLVHCQTSTHMVDYANWMRRMWRVPVINTHTVHLPTHSHFVLSDGLFGKERVRNAVRHLAESQERNFAKLYNHGDCLIVQSRYFVDYWRERGVTVPIEVVGRPIDPSKFSSQPQSDPFPVKLGAGTRFLVVCRHDREKRLDHLIDIFANYIAPRDSDATLTLVGDGHDHTNLVARAMATPYANRIHFSGEQKHDRLVDWYAHADVFVYTSVSETFGNVINEALWSGLPVVGLDDRMGVAHQVLNEINGFLVEPDTDDTDKQFAAACLLLERSKTLRRRMGEQAANIARMTSHPKVVLDRFETIYENARDHCRAAVKEPLCQKSRLTQMQAFAFHVGRWAWYNSRVLGIAYTATTLGAGRKGGANQYQAPQGSVHELPASAPGTNRSVA